jgi:hypothetical protein
MQIEKGSKKHRVCFADDRPNGRTSGVILIKTYNVESFKDFNKIADTDATTKISKTGKDKYVEDIGDSGFIHCNCRIF